MNPMHNLLTLGYQTAKTPEVLLATAKKYGALVADIRFMPRSRDPRWNKNALVKLLGDRYVHVHAFGNKNYKGGPIEFVDPDRGTVQIGELLVKSNVILLCTCWDIATCHRKPAAELVAARFSVKVIHLGKDDLAALEQDAPDKPQLALF